MLLLYPFECCFDVLSWIFDCLNTNYSSQKDIFRGIVGIWWNHTGTVYQIDTFREGNVLPDLGLSGYLKT